MQAEVLRTGVAAFLKPIGIDKTQTGIPRFVAKSTQKRCLLVHLRLTAEPFIIPLLPDIYR
jgi:hypothetical protein